MRCSSCEPLLSEYVDGTLSARRMADVAKHVHSCTSCTALKDELNVVDGLLATAPLIELPVNFTFAVMADARSMPAPQQTRLTITKAIIGYLLAVWVVVGTYLLLRGSSAFSAVGDALSPLAGAWHVFATVVADTGRAIAPNAALLGVVIGVILTIDLLALVGLVYFYRTVRPRLLAAVTVKARR